jgi:hypothetical protein
MLNVNMWSVAFFIVMLIVSNAEVLAFMLMHPLGVRIFRIRQNFFLKIVNRSLKILKPCIALKNKYCGLNHELKYLLIKIYVEIKRHLTFKKLFYFNFKLATSKSQHALVKF